MFKYFNYLARLIIIGAILSVIPDQYLWAQQPDQRNISEGISIYENSYIDQPYVVVLKNGSWLCVFTTGASTESRPGQHVVAIASKDQGRHWTAPVNIEPDTGAISSWAIPYLTSYGRIYTFYNYNGDHISMLNDKPVKQAGLLGWYCYKYSDDNGLTWSKRYRLPVRKTPVDMNNDFKGQVQLLWGIDKPHLIGKSVYFAFTKLGKFPQSLGEGWFFKSSNLDLERNPDKISWQLLPDGDKGLRNPQLGSVQEEFNLVQMSDGSIYTVFRTENGFIGNSYSHDGGKTWQMPEPARYHPQSAQLLKNPRACPRLFKCANGKYLLWYHNHGGKDFKSRNPAWISGGVEKNGVIEWSQPEILLYDNDLTVNGMSYPDLIEQHGKYWLTETQKSKARVHQINPSLLAGLWGQGLDKKITANGLVVNKQTIKQGLALPLSLPSLITGGFTVDIWVKFKDTGPGQVLLDNRKENGKGICIKTTAEHTLKIELSDGLHTEGWDTDPGTIVTDKLQHIVFIVDGAANIITVIADGKLCDGGTSRQYGWGRISNELGDVNGAPLAKLIPNLRGEVKSLRIYNRYLTTSAAISNFNAGIK